MQRFHIRQPGERDVVIGEPARDQNGDLVRLGPIEGPFVDGGQPLDDVDGMLATLVGAGVGFDEGHQGSFGGSRNEAGSRLDLSGRATRRNLADSRPFVNRRPFRSTKTVNGIKALLSVKASPIKALAR